MKLDDAPVVYGLKIRVKGAFDEVVERTKSALKDEGFGVLTEIDVKATLKKKIGADVPEQVILGACSPTFAHRAMQEEPDLGLLLPCNVVVRQADDGEYFVSAVDPVALLSVVGRSDIQSIAEEVRGKLEKALAALS